jgi:hypothetical protein
MRSGETKIEPYRLVEYLLSEGFQLLAVGGSPPLDMLHILFGDL